MTLKCSSCSNRRRRRRRRRHRSSDDESRSKLSREKRGRGKRWRNSKDSSRKESSGKVLGAVIDESNYSQSDSRLICASTGTSKSLILGRRFTDEESDQDDEFFSYAEATSPLLVRGKSSGAGTPTARQSVKSVGVGAEDNKEGDKKSERTIHPRKNGSDRFPLRRSLFPNVPPYVSFDLEKCGATVSPLTIPRNLGQLMRWKLSHWTPPIIRRVVEASGFRFASCGWSGSWDNAFPKNCERLTYFQKVNHFPVTGLKLGRKDQLSLSINAMARKFGRKDFGFAPQTFVLPRERLGLMAAWKTPNNETETANKWIVKPPSSARGTGVRVISQWWEVPANSYLVIQRYLTRPMLINGAKFDVRLYVLVTSFDPLKVYLYSDGLVRIATRRYDPDAKHHRDRFMHLTNTSVNKYSESYSPTGHLWRLKTLRELFERRSIDFEQIWREIKDIIVKTLIAVEGAVAPVVRKILTSRYTCFELFGFDILIEDDLRPWLLEVNTAPSLQTDSSVHSKVKGPLVKTLLNIAGFQVPPDVSEAALHGSFQLSTPEKRAPLLAQNFHLYDKTRAHQATRKQFNYSFRSRAHGEYLDAILHQLTPDDVRLLVIYEDEISQLELFEKIFPTPKSHRYLEYFSGPGYYDLLLDAWERAHGFSRINGIRRLQDLCRQNYHLMP